MNPLSLSIAAALLCFTMSLLVFLRGYQSLVSRLLAIGLVFLALEQAMTSMGLQALSSDDVIRWQRLKSASEALVAAIWLVFSFSFGRSNYRDVLKKWKWLVVAFFTLPISLVIFFGSSFFEAFVSTRAGGLVRLNWPGYLFYILMLFSSILILVNLEQTLRASTGSMRWQIKFMILGVGGLFAFRIYMHSQTLLFSSLSMTLQEVQGGALIVAGLLICISLLRGHLDVDIYVSHSFLYNSVTILSAGVYLVAVGFLAKAIDYLGGAKSLAIQTFFVFCALLVLTIVLLSDSLRLKFKFFFSRHFKRPLYDYRKEWMDFTRRTASMLKTKDLCAAVAKMLSDTFKIPAVTIWLVDESTDMPFIEGSTVFSDVRTCAIESEPEGPTELVRFLGDQKMLVDFSDPRTDWIMRFKQTHGAFLDRARIRFAIPLLAGEEFLGFLTLSDRVSGQSFSLEDLDLIKTISDQAAASLLNARLSERLIRAKEMETFQSMSAFFVHDLKNLASTLSLTTQNMETHFDNPTFREDALRTISQGVMRIQDICRRLSHLRGKLELKRSQVKLDDLVNDTLQDIGGLLDASIVKELDDVSRLSIDPEQMKKVLVNLVLNANEAAGNKGEIRICTRQQDGQVVLSVEDNGCGMSQEFMDRSLFRPFQTTKKHGLGIGLFHSKMIVEAHGGKIEVESEEGRGSTFRVNLPMATG